MEPSAQEHHRALDELTHRLDNRPELFAGNSDIGQNFPELVAFHRHQGTEPVARRILQKHLDAGFSQSYIYDLLAEEYFHADDADGALNLIETLRARPILTDLGNSPSYAWAGLAALAAGHTAEAVRLAHASHWLQPILPISRILVSALSANDLFPRNNEYPISPKFITNKPTLMDKFKPIAQRIASTQSGCESSSSFNLNFIPYELELRDWVSLQTIRLPSPFWNIPNQRKMIRFFRSTFRKSLNDPTVMSMLGQLYCQAENDELGTPLIEEAYQLAPEDAFVNLRLARLRRLQQLNVEALALYDEAVALSDGQICFRAELGMVRLQLGDKDGAVSIFRELAEIDHQIIEVLILTADILRRKVRYLPIALRIAQKADRLVPGGARSTQILRKILERLGRDDEAEAIRARLIAWKRNPGKFSSRIASTDTSR